MPKSLATVVLVVLIAAAAYWLFFPHDDMNIVPATDTASAPATPPAATPPQPVLREETPAPATDNSTSPGAPAEVQVDDSIVAPPAALDGSDAQVMAAVASLHPAITQWLLPDEQVRKWVALINQLADGKVPVKDRPLEYPLPPFKVNKEGDTLWLERSNYRRATTLIKALSQMPPSRVAKHYQAWLPLFEQAQNELGNGKQFNERLHTAIDRIMAVHPLTGEIELHAGVLKFTYADPTREQASALEKALWRLGPGNTLRIQNYLRDLTPLL